MNELIDEKEWNFRCLVDEEVSPCLNYELWREAEKVSPDFVARLRRVRSRLEKGETLGGMRDLLFSGDFVPSEIVALSCWLQYFPHTPFLQIPREKRRDLPAFESRRPYSAGVPINYPITLIDRGIRAENCFAPFEINWDFKDDKILTDFKQWLEGARPQNRPGLAEKPSLKMARARLKELAAYRLSRAMQVMDAIAYSEEKCGKALYAGPQSWSRAEAGAKRLIEDFAARARQ